MKKNKDTKGTERVDAVVDRLREDSALGASSRGGYSLSSATAVPLKRRLRGRWAVSEHRLGDEPYLARFALRALKGVELAEPEYRAEYEFREALCIKRVEIVGSVQGADASAEYRYRLRVASSWDLDGPEHLSIRPELGYQSTELDGETAAVKDLDEAPDPVSVSFRFDGDSLVLEEGEDFKRLERL